LHNKNGYNYLEIQVIVATKFFFTIREIYFFPGICVTSHPWKLEKSKSRIEQRDREVWWTTEGTVAFCSRNENCIEPFVLYLHCNFEYGCTPCHVKVETWNWIVGRVHQKPMDYLKGGKCAFKTPPTLYPSHRSSLERKHL